jgi:hypothetical protein
MATKKTGPSTLRGSKRARQITVAVLEALAGEVGTTQAAEKLGISLSRYYQLESRALAGMMEAVEPRGRGPQKTPEREIRALRAEKRTLEKELRRQQSLLRAAHRSVGLPSRGAKGSSSPKRRRAKRSHRGRTVRQTLRPSPDAGEGGTDGTTKRDGDAGGPDTSQPRSA